MTILGAIFLPDNPPERLRQIAVAADEAGLEELWLWEDCFKNSGVAAASAALAWTRNLRVGIGIMPVPLRNVALTAMEIATMRRMFGERAIVGIGHGVLDWMGQVGERAASPMTLLREYASALRSLLDGETVNTQGRYVRLENVRLDWPPAPAPPIYLGATGVKTLALSGELAQGTILTGGTPPEGIARARAAIGVTDHHVVTFVCAAFGPGAAERLADQQRRYGIDDPGVAGDAKTVAEELRRYAEAGADTIVLQPTVDDPDPVAFVRYVAEEVRPLLS